jgi:hypothetical protein
MAITREIWINSIMEGFFADNTFADMLTDHSTFVNGSVVHVPNAGAIPSVTIGRSTFPATAKARTDSDLSYPLKAFSIDPVRIPNAEQYELSYDKRNSVIGASRSALQDAVYSYLLTQIATTATASVTAAKFSKSTLQDIRKQFDKANVPLVDRCVVLTPDAYVDLLADLTDAEALAFTATANAATGKVGMLYGFTVYERSVVDTTESSKVSAVAWQKSCASRALGPIDIFEDEASATMYGDVISAELRAGGGVIRSDKAGVAVVKTA